MISALLAAPASADVVFYRLPTTRGDVVMLEGATTVNPGGTVTFSHPRFGKIHFDLASTEIRKAPTVSAQFSRVLGRAGSDAEKRMEAAQWALRHGLLAQFYSTIDKVLEANPRHPRALLVRQLKAQMDAPLADPSRQEQELRKLVPLESMKFKTSKHFLLMHDTPDTLTKGKLTRADERLQLLETVYECFLLRFYAYGVALEVPKERLKVVLFNDYQQFRQFADKQSPALASASGFWDGETNTSVFFDHGTNDEFKALKQISDELQFRKEEAVRTRAGNAANLVRTADTLKMLVEIERENCDIEVVSHETTHQMAGNTGLLPRHVRIPTWVHEGLATYFETPDGATWGGIGEVNASRLSLYRDLEWDKTHSNIGFIVGDQIFDFARTTRGTLHGYGQSWALTHFLLEKHFDKFMTFYRRLGELPPDTFLSSDVVNRLFDESLGLDRNVLDSQWRLYMSNLKTDVELILEGQ
ncbi:MAG TPA: DUF1570 domain-containing protein [Pirellulaceae bacterium]|nr:DUF1570 domain-containing protein [Pirellulaceae bacterium]